MSILMKINGRRMTRSIGTRLLVTARMSPKTKLLTQTKTTMVHVTFAKSSISAKTDILTQKNGLLTLLITGMQQIAAT